MTKTYDLMRGESKLPLLDVYSKPSQIVVLSGNACILEYSSKTYLPCRLGAFSTTLYWNALQLKLFKPLVKQVVRGLHCLAQAIRQLRKTFASSTNIGGRPARSKQMFHATRVPLLGDAQAFMCNTVEAKVENTHDALNLMEVRVVWTSTCFDDAVNLRVHRTNQAYCCC